MSTSAPRLTRRNFLLAAAGGAAAAAAVAGKSPRTPRVKAEVATGAAGYRLTEHIRRYYNTAKV